MFSTWFDIFTRRNYVYQSGYYCLFDISIKKLTDPDEGFIFYFRVQNTVPVHSKYIISNEKIISILTRSHKIFVACSRYQYRGKSFDGDDRVRKYNPSPINFVFYFFFYKKKNKTQWYVLVSNKKLLDARDLSVIILSASNIYPQPSPETEHALY